MRRIKRILSILFMLLVFIYSVSGCSVDQQEDVFETVSNAPLKTEDDNQLYYTQSPLLYKEFSLLYGDGDGTPDYLIEHSLMDVFGGHGDYIINIYAKSDTDKYDKIIFNSVEYLSVHKNMDIEVTAIRDGTIVFSHQETGYEKEYVVHEDAYLFPYLFNADGSSKGSLNFVIDSFKTVEIVDINNDGVEEILLEQYASVGWHANHFADCISVFKFIDDGMLTLISIELVNK